MRIMMNTIMSLPLALVSVAATGCAGIQANETAAPNQRGGSTPEVVLTSEVAWAPLNPARGDSSPKAGTLWGDRNGTGPTGFLVQFVDGFSSPPHIHNVSYRGVVINGLIHNDGTNVGIGSSDPDRKLDVAGDIRATGGDLELASDDRGIIFSGGSTIYKACG